MNIRHIALFGILSFALVGCTSKVATQTEMQVQEEPTVAPAQPESENMMERSETPVVQATPVDVSTDSALKGAAALKTTDDTKSLQTDLNSTTIVNEDFK